MQSICFILAVLLTSRAYCHYLPGVSARAFKDDELVSFKVQTLTSMDKPLQFDFYQLPFCRPDKIVDTPENLGEALTGDKSQTSLYEVNVKANQYCKILCRKKYSADEIKQFEDSISFGYRANMLLDSLPVAEINTYAYQDNMNETVQVYHLGYPIGTKAESEEGQDSKSKFVLNNHLRFKILYKVAYEDEYESPGPHSFIVGFQVIPFSIKHTYSGTYEKNTQLTSCSQPPSSKFETDLPMTLETQESSEVIWTYDVEWVPSDIKWEYRWDVYLQMTDDRIHWLAIVNSLVIVLFLTGVVGIIMARILRRDFARYNEIQLTDEEKLEATREMRDETGWKLVYGDVFRPPPSAMFLAALCGVGMQLSVMSLSTLIFAALGMLSPANRGSLVSSVLIFFVLAGITAGYISARLSRVMRVTNRWLLALTTAVMVPGVCFVVFFLVNVLAWAKQSSSAVPFGTLVVVLALWFFVSLPMGLLGTFVANLGEPIQLPVPVNPIPRQIPGQPWFFSRGLCIAAGGLLPFGAMFVELFFILSSIWQHRFYYVFGFLTLIFVILVATCAEVTVVFCYLHLCAEDPRWWWRSFLTSGSTAVYMFLYGAYHFLMRSDPSLPVDLLAASVYFGYLGILSYAVFVLTGFVGFFSCFYFVKKIYGSIKID